MRYHYITEQNINNCVGKKIRELRTARAFTVLDVSPSLISVRNEAGNCEYFTRSILKKYYVVLV